MQRILAVIFFLVVFLQHQSQAQCNSTNCVGPACRCMSTSSPGGLTKAQTQRAAQNSRQAVLSAKMANRPAIIAKNRHAPGVGKSKIPKAVNFSDPLESKKTNPATPVTRGLDWMKNPKPLAEVPNFFSCPTMTQTPCSDYSCYYEDDFSPVGPRNMKSCVICPDVANGYLHQLKYLVINQEVEEHFKNV
ncbi:hypothetical protein DAPPUDRAFT_259853 [Daphnia pulex]|uniref:Uncharacterized protein n=1 Tax=Daphnia pulex TaxID=6669 RepID=E9HI05_DAPPU|nr:hypothetical protein DAPPUDRAFT_259853 [Daphnia pulex]|eukprot:EFX68641.1 hypothetical protein DAPPUDRAFT_259853 [Daphnia pulex]